MRIGVQIVVGGVLAAACLFAVQLRSGTMCSVSSIPNVEYGTPWGVNATDGAFRVNEPYVSIQTMDFQSIGRLNGTFKPGTQVRCCSVPAAHCVYPGDGDRVRALADVLWRHVDQPATVSRRPPDWDRLYVSLVHHCRHRCGHEAQPGLRASRGAVLPQCQIERCRPLHPCRLGTLQWLNCQGYESRRPSLEEPASSADRCCCESIGWIVKLVLSTFAKDIRLLNTC